MSIHTVRFQSRSGVGPSYKLLCEIDTATATPRTSDLTFTDQEAMDMHIKSSGIQWGDDGERTLFDRWFVVTSRQLSRLGFKDLLGSER